MSDFDRTQENIEHHISEVDKEYNYLVFCLRIYEVLLDASLKNENQTITHLKYI